MDDMPLDIHTLKNNLILSYKKTDSPLGYLAIMKFLFSYGLVSNLNTRETLAAPYQGRWCYPSFTEALLAMATWNLQGDPPGPWIKYKGAGPERHNPKLFDHVGGSYWKRNTTPEEDTWD